MKIKISWSVSKFQFKMKTTLKIWKQKKVMKQIMMLMKNKLLKIMNKE